MQNYTWIGPAESVACDAEGMATRVRALDAPCYAVQNERGVGLTNEGSVQFGGDGAAVLAMVPPTPAQQLGDPGFRATYGLDYAYMAGSMANAIASTELVIALGKAGMLGAFGAGGLVPNRLETAIRQIQEALPHGPYAFNLINNPNEPALERQAMELYLRHGVHVIEASAYLTLTPYVVQYRVAGLEPGPDGEVVIRNRVIAKISRREVATLFMQPAPAKLLTALREQGLITATQAHLAERVPLADDVTVEADSGGHTDNRPLVCLMPSLLALRDELQAQYHYPTPVRVGAAGGIGTPTAALGAFMMGAAYVLTGSINHSCVEAGTSPHVKQLLAQAAMTDVMMAPAADMFEMGVNLQVLKRGTMFPLRARKLYEIYQTYASIEAIPPAERQKLEQQIFRRTLDEVWADCITFFNQRDPAQIEKAQRDPRRQMALIFRWYLGLATRWAVVGEPGREVDYQIWCGPAMGAFNDWVRGTPLEQPENRHVAEIGRRIMDEAALLYRVQTLRMQGVTV
ncbi:MAG TPA: PfaD family polyunsaturated fatty acid/polyketide biosynthesis protein [Anaerolineae bacterium]|nr:PfaD family polyunsaturated fatty acid/polyketide biosynthesis protein [Anaerolineae bacterium]HQH39005.1 PfaD family polyunsaturated fatty acid/polyketide biosynthesis protein [Anaerolineae bacterium]